MIFVSITRNFVIGFLLFLTACNQAPQQKRAAKESNSSEDVKKSDEEEEKEEEEENDLPPDFTAEGTEKTDAEIASLLADCGGGDAINAPADKVIYDRLLTSLPITTVRTEPLIGAVTVVSDSTLAIRVTGATTEQTSKVTIKSLLPPLAATLGKAKADAEAAANSGKATLVNVPFKKYATLSQYKQWEGVTCAFVPVTSIDNSRGGRTTKASFDPPVPSSISPRATAKRYEAEIGKTKTFSDIKIKVNSSDHPDLKGKTNITGTITFEKIDSSTSVDDGKGGKQEIKSDLAYRVTYNFGDPKTTFALGFSPVVLYYISHSKKDLVANIVDTTSAGGGIAVFLHP